MTINKNKLILLNASPVGDHVVLLDLAHRFYLSNNIKSIMFIKHNFVFLRDLGLGYSNFIEFVDFNKISGKLKFLFMCIHSLFYKDIIIYFLPIIYKKYLIIIGNIFNYFTRCKVISLEYKGLENYIPKGIHIKANISNMYYWEQSNNILRVLGYKETEESPHFLFIDDKNIKDRLNIKNKYIVIHPTPSKIERKLEDKDWQEVFKNISKEHDIVFTGSNKDKEYLYYLSKYLINNNNIHVLIDLNGQDLINIFDKAEYLYMVHTGPTHIATALHKKMKVFAHLWLKQFDMSYNKNAEVIILSKVENEIELNRGFGFKL